MKDKIYTACVMHGGAENCIEHLAEKCETRDHLQV